MYEQSEAEFSQTFRLDLETNFQTNDSKIIAS